jgi:hypothetical protein
LFNSTYKIDRVPIDLHVLASEQERRQRFLSLIQPALLKPITPRCSEAAAEGSTMSLQRDKVEWELPHFKEAHQMQVSNMGAPVFEGYSCVTLLFAG